MADKPKTVASEIADKAVVSGPIVSGSAASGRSRAAKAAVAGPPPVAVPLHAETGETVLPAVPEVAADPVPVSVAPAEITPVPPMGMAKTSQPAITETVMKNAEEFVSFAQGNFEAMMKSSQIWATGLQDLSKQMAANAQSTLDETVATMKALSGVKSLKEAVDLQSSLARSSMEKAMAGTTQMADASMKLAEQAIAPITARMQLATSKFVPAA